MQTKGERQSEGEHRHDSFCPCADCQGEAAVLDRVKTEKPTLAELRAAAVKEYNDALAAGYRPRLRAEYKPRVRKASRAELLAACEAMREALRGLLPMWESGIKEPWVEKARAALALADRALGAGKHVGGR